MSSSGFAGKARLEKRKLNKKHLRKQAERQYKSRSVELVPDNLNQIVGHAGPDADISGLSMSCKHIQRVTNDQFIRRRDAARAEIKKLLGELIWLEKGSFVMRSIRKQFDQKYVKIRKAYLMPQDMVTEERYKYLL